MRLGFQTLFTYWWLISSCLQIIFAKGYDHHRRHHHDDHMRHRGQQHPPRSDYERKDWDLHSLSFVADESDPPMEPDSDMSNSDHHPSSDSSSDEAGIAPRSKSSFDENVHRFEKFPKDSKRVSKVAKKGQDNSRGTSEMFYNSSHGALPSGYAGHSVYADGQIYDSDGFGKRSHFPANVDPDYPDKAPVPAPSRARSQSTFTNNDDTNNNYISNSRWTLKYKGMPSEQELNNTRVNITAKLGGSAFLPCRVGHLGDRQISWIRRRDWHVLTSGRILYTHDQRFSVLHEPGSQDWTLHIKWVNMRDVGAYECQVSTGTGIISLFVKLSVVIPEAYIPGDGQYHVDKGSAISLSCYIRNSPAPPQYILWHHNAELLNFLRDRPDIKISDDLHKRRNQFGFHYPLANGIDSGFTENMKGNEDMSISRLQVPFADDIHSGNYTCSAPNTQAASTLVFITEGDKTAAVQRIDSGAFHSSIEIGFIAMSLFISFLFLS